MRVRSSTFNFKETQQVFIIIYVIYFTSTSFSSFSRSFLISSSTPEVCRGWGRGCSLSCTSVGNSHSASSCLPSWCCMKSLHHLLVEWSNFKRNLLRSALILPKFRLAMFGCRMAGSPAGMPSVISIPPFGSHSVDVDHYLYDSVARPCPFRSILNWWWWIWPLISSWTGSIQVFTSNMESNSTTSISGV